jgi:hypothetical protein
MVTWRQRMELHGHGIGSYSGLATAAGFVKADPHAMLYDIRTGCSCPRYGDR